MTDLATTSRSRPGDMDQPIQVDVTDRLPPYDFAAEIALLGSMIIDPDVIDPVCSIIPTAEMFYDERDQILFKVIVDVYEENQRIDTLLVSSALRSRNLFEAAGGLKHLSDVINAVPSSAHAEYYAGIVRDKSLLRGVISACTQSLKDVYESGDTAKEIVDRAEQRIFDLVQHKTTNTVITSADAVAEAMRVADERADGGLSGIPTGFVEIDNMTRGLQRGEMIILAARPSVGKSALMMDIVEHVAVDQGRPTGVFSLEMPARQLAFRMMCSRSGIPNGFCRGQQEHSIYQNAVADITNAPIFYDDSPTLSLVDFRAKARRMKKESNVELIAIDYLQLMDCQGIKDSNRQQEISTISRGIKAVARELNVPIIVLSQLNRLSETQNRLPRTSDLRESGAIEQDADVIILLHRESVARRGDEEWKANQGNGPDLALAIIGKQRNGPCDTVKLSFRGELIRFENYNPGV